MAAKTLAFIFFSLFLHASFAATFEREKAVTVCEQIAQEMQELASNPPETDLFCTDNVIRASTALQFASQAISQENLLHALIHLLSAEKALRVIQLRRENCSYFANAIKPHLPLVIALRQELSDETDTYHLT
ncbi:MAG: hypothetical protein WC785_08020 [Tatlockia sp.]